MSLRKKFDQLDVSLTKFHRKIDLGKLFNYEFDKKIFRVAVVLCVLLFVLAWGLDGFGNLLDKNVYFKCPDNAGPCENPFWEGCDTSKVFSGVDCITLLYDEHRVLGEEIKEMHFVPAGFEFGKKENFVIRNWGLLVFIILALAFVLNHLLHNKGWRPVFDEGGLR